MTSRRKALLEIPSLYRKILVDFKEPGAAIIPQKPNILHPLHVLKAHASPSAVLLSPNTSETYSPGQDTSGKVITSSKGTSLAMAILCVSDTQYPTAEMHKDIDILTGKKLPAKGYSYFLSELSCCVIRGQPSQGQV